MNLGIVVPGFSASETDPCIPALLALIRKLSERHSVRVLALRYPHCSVRYRVHGIPVTTLGGARARGLTRIPLLARAFGTIAREHHRAPFDVLHAFWADEPGFLAARAGRMLGVPSAVTLLGGELVALPELGYGGQLSRLNRRLARAALAGASAVTAGSRSLLALAREGAPHACWLPIGVDLERFRPGPSPGLLEGAPRILHVASLVPVKGQDVLLRAFAKLARAHPRAVLHLVGDGPLRGALESRARELGVGGDVRLHGAVSHGELRPYYLSADLCAMSSWHEGQEWVTQEAGACGRTTVGTDVGVVPDLEPATIAVPRGDADALANGLARALADRHLPREMGERARRRVAADYSLAATVKRLDALYERLTRYNRRTSLTRSRSATISVEKPTPSSASMKAASPSVERQSRA